LNLLSIQIYNLLKRKTAWCKKIVKTNEWGVIGSITDLWAFLTRIHTAIYRNKLTEKKQTGKRKKVFFLKYMSSIL